ncbi:MAG TPA: hypothetical protein VHB79_10135 [Polyangiaceae bacterium]|nr:hypothetical protein [Polyangiaceae bacterium]
MTTDDLTRLFEAERAASPPPGGLERGLGRLLGDVARGAAPLPVAATSLKLGLSLASKWLALGFVVGLGGAGAASQIWAPEAAAAPSARPSLVAVAEPARAEPSRAAPSTLAPAVAAPEAAPVRAVGNVAPSPSSHAESEPTTDEARLDEELRLVAAAKRELELGKASLATAWLAEHAARFPNGVFAIDRDALRILVRCSQKKDPELAQRFAAAHPSSPVVERLQRACSPGAGAAESAVDFPKIDK